MIKIVSKTPKEYLEQGLIHCGAYSVKAILSAYGKDDRKNPKDYEVGFWAKHTAIADATQWLKVLRSYGLNATRSTSKNLTSDKQIKLFESVIDRDTPVMVRIGNGYLKSGRYSKFVAIFGGHWVTLWGYNNLEKVFYVYDSYVPLGRHDKNIPVGNVKRTYQQILRDIGKGFPLRWRYHYIALDVSPKL
jgi:hypothetical protein